MYDTRVVFNSGQNDTRVNTDLEDSASDSPQTLSSPTGSNEHDGVEETILVVPESDTIAIAELLPLDDTELTATILAKEVLISPATMQEGPLMLFRVFLHFVPHVINCSSRSGPSFPRTGMAKCS